MGLKRAKVADISFIRAFGLWFLLMVLAGVCLGIIGIALSIEPSMTQEMILSAVTWFIVSLIAVTLIYKSSWMMSAKAVMPHAILEFALVAAILFILRPFIFEAFVISSNSMAPTLVGEHVEVPCPTCGHPAFGSLPEPGRENMEDGVLMICSNEFRTVKISGSNTCHWRIRSHCCLQIDLAATLGFGRFQIPRRTLNLLRHAIDRITR